MPDVVNRDAAPTATPGGAWWWLERIVSAISRALAGVAVVAVVLLMAHVIADVAMRYFAGRPLHGTIDWVSYWWMVLLAFLGFVVAAQRRDHIDVPLYTDRLSPRNQVVLMRVAHLLAALFVLAIVWFGWENALEQFAKQERTGATHVPIWPMRFVVPAVCGVFVVQTLLALRRPPPSDDRSAAESETDVHSRAD